MDREKSLLPVSAVAEYLYCPRNFYYRMVECADDANYHLIEGIMQEELREAREYLRRDGYKQIRKVTLSSETYGIIGRLDVIEEKDGVMYPVEYKKGVLRNNVNDNVQLCCQALLLEENYGIEVDKGYICYIKSASRREVLINEELRQYTLQIINQARQMLDDAVVPEPLSDNRCNGCSMLSRCLPQEVRLLRGQSNKVSKILPSASMDRVLYVDTPGAYLRKKEGCISITKENEIIKQVPINNLDQVVVMGQVNATVQLMDELLRRNIPTFFYSYNGQLSGWLQPPYGKNSVLRVNQFKCYQDDNFKLRLAKRFIGGKISNSRTLLMRYNRILKDEVIKRTCDVLRHLAKKLESASDMETLLGIEGTAARSYFAAVSDVVKPHTGFKYSGRNRRPPRDPVNALLSFGYALLLKDVISEINRVGLDPHIGFLHTLVYGRPALALDMMEEFRAVIADSAVFTAINKEMIGIDDFEINDNECKISESGRKSFFQAYRNRMTDTIKHPVFGYELSYRRTIELQVRMLAKVINGEIDEYIPFMVR